MTPCSKRSRALAGALLLAGCATGGAGFESVTTLPKAARHPAGSDVDRQAELPGPTRRGVTDTGLVVLRAPLDPAAARGVVAAFFRAVVEESPRGLSLLLTRDAVMQNAGRRESAIAL